jgi:AAA15 family ATPase/GTPase
MLKSLQIENLTVFPKADLKFGKNLNVIIGENGSGKTHILKAIYCPLAASSSRRAKAPNELPTKEFLSNALADKFRNVFRPDDLGRLVSRQPGNRTCKLAYEFQDKELNLEFHFSRPAKSEVKILKVPARWVEMAPAFLPTRELITLLPEFPAFYDNNYTRFEETWRDTCGLLGAFLARGAREKAVRALLDPLEKAMGGNVEVDKSGRFYLKLASGSMEMHLVAEGLRKLAMLAYLVATGALLDKGCLFWDEPESNLNPRIIKTVARTILQIAKSGIQVFIATHSLFLLREIHILQQKEFMTLDSRCFGLHIGPEGAVNVDQGKTMDEVGSIAALEEDLSQSERYLDMEMGVGATQAQPSA